MPPGHFQRFPSGSVVSHHFEHDSISESQGLTCYDEIAPQAAAAVVCPNRGDLPEDPSISSCESLPGGLTTASLPSTLPLAVNRRCALSCRELTCLEYTDVSHGVSTARLLSLFMDEGCLTARQHLSVVRLQSVCVLCPNKVSIADFSASRTATRVFCR